MMRLKRSVSIPQWVGYAGVGTLVNGGGYLLFLLLLFIGVEHKQAATVTYILGVVISFLLNRRVVFSSEAPLFSSIIRLCVMIVTGYGLNVSILYVCVDKMNGPAGIVQLLSIGVVSVYFYFLNKYFVHGSCAS